MRHVMPPERLFKLVAEALWGTDGISEAEVRPNGVYIVTDDESEWLLTDIFDAEQQDGLKGIAVGDLRAHLLSSWHNPGDLPPLLDDLAVQHDRLHDNARKGRWYDYCQPHTHGEA